MTKDVSNEPMTQLEVYRLVEAHGQKVAAAVIDAVNLALTEALNAIMEHKAVELVAGPASVKRIKRDASGQIEYLEEYGQLPQAADPGIPSEVAAQVNLLAALDVASRR